MFAYTGGTHPFNQFPLSSLKKNLLYNFLLSASQVLLPLVSIPYVSRVLNPDGIGRVSFIDSFTYYFISIAEFGIMVYGMRGIARLKNNEVERARYASELIALHFISSSCALLLYSISVVVLWNKIQDFRLLLFSLLFLLVNFFACEWYFLGMERFRYITLRSLLVRLLALVMMFLLVRSPKDDYVYYAIMVVAAITISIWNNIILFNEMPLKLRGVDWKKHIRFTRVTYFISLTYGVTLLLDNVLLRLVSTVAAVGLYAFSMKVVRIGSTLLTDSLLVFFPRIVSMIQEKNEKGLQQVALQNMQLITLLSIPLSVGVFLLSEQMVMVIFGEKFYPAIADLKILSIFPVLRACNLFLSKQVLIAHNEEELYLRSLVLGGVLFIPITLVLSYFFADRGAAFAMLIAEVIILVMNYSYVKRTVPGLRIFDQVTIVHAIIGSLLFIPLVYFVNRITGNDHFLVLVICIPACFVSYFLVQIFITRNTFMLLLKGSMLQYLKPAGNRV